MLSVSVVKGYQSTLASVFKYKLHEHQDSFVLHALIRSFRLRGLSVLSAFLLRI